MTDTPTTDFASVDLFRAGELYQDPFPYYEWLRSKGPVWIEPKRGVVMVTGFEEAQAVFGDTDTYSNCNAVSGPFVKFPEPFEGDDVSDVIDACHALGRQVILLAFFGKGDLKGDDAGTDEVVRRLQKLAPKAEQLGVVLGIASWLSAEEHMAIIDRIGSSAVKVYYDVANSHQRGYDVPREIRWLGKQGQICEFHMKENGALLGQGRIDFKKVRAALDDIGYTGPMQIEGAVPPGGKLIESYIANRKFLQGNFPAKA